MKRKDSSNRDKYSNHHMSITCNSLQTFGSTVGEGGGGGGSLA